MPSVTNQFPSHGHRALHRDKETETQPSRTTQGREGQTLTKMETKRGLTPTRPQLVMLNGSLGTHQAPSPHLWISPGVGRLDSESKELRPNVTANRPHKVTKPRAALPPRFTLVPPSGTPLTKTHPDIHGWGGRLVGGAVGKRSNPLSFPSRSSTRIPIGDKRHPPASSELVRAGWVSGRRA